MAGSDHLVIDELVLAANVTLQTSVAALDKIAVGVHALRDQGFVWRVLDGVRPQPA